MEQESRREEGERGAQMKYFLYARKSTDEDDKQLLSIEAQLEELRDNLARLEETANVHADKNTESQALQSQLQQQISETNQRIMAGSLD